MSNQTLLKESTAELHNELEKIMFVDKIKDGSLTFADYQTILLTNYALHHKYENFLLDGLSSSISLQLEVVKRRKLAALEKDMVQAGLTIPQNNIDTNPTLAISNTNAARLGALYVFEGAMLGGNVIVKLLRSNAQLKDHQLNYFYYSHYAENLADYWKKFCAVLNEQESSAGPSILSAAEIIFKDFIRVAKNTI